MKSKNPRILAFLLLVLFLSFQGGRMLCHHTHVLGGRVISHSHPFNNPDRQHSAEELISLCQICSGTITDDLTSDDCQPPIAAVKVKYYFSGENQPDYGYSRDAAGRAPPRV